MGALKVLIVGGPGLRQMSVGREGVGVRVNDVSEGLGMGSSELRAAKGRWVVVGILRLDSRAG